MVINWVFKVYFLYFVIVIDVFMGIWRVIVKVGGVIFIKNFCIEIVKFNWIKINFDFGMEQFSVVNVFFFFIFQANWLYGVLAFNFEVCIEVQL